MTRSRRGNLLLSALFMSAFLFFLSVAIVVTNREDIRSTLLADHKMRAEFAADGTLDRDIQLMRSNPEWESALNNGVSFSSGAVVQSSIKRISPTILELDVQATSNLVRADRHWFSRGIPTGRQSGRGQQQAPPFRHDRYQLAGSRSQLQVAGSGRPGLRGVAPHF